MIVKICGITRLEDARMAVRWGANALGFNFYPASPRFTTARLLAEVARELPSSVLKVGVFVRGSGPPPQDLLGLLDVVQIHGVEHEEDVPKLNSKIWVAVSPREASSFPHHDIIIDASWGRGKRADWDLLRGLNRPFILSGGLTAANVTLALEKLNPAGVDVCSGVELSPGIKDPARLRAFLQCLGSFEEGKGKEPGASASDSRSAP